MAGGGGGPKVLFAMATANNHSYFLSTQETGILNSKKERVPFYPMGTFWLFKMLAMLALQWSQNRKQEPFRLHVGLFMITARLRIMSATNEWNGQLYSSPKEFWFSYCTNEKIPYLLCITRT